MSVAAAPAVTTDVAIESRSPLTASEDGIIRRDKRLLDRGATEDMEKERETERRQVPDGNSEGGGAPQR